MRRQAFSLVELLVVITIMLVLMGLAGAALSNARTSQKRQETQGLIAKLDAVIQQQFASYAGREVTAISPTDRANKLRQQVTGDLPDRWVDVKFMADEAAAAAAAVLPRVPEFDSPHQRAYIAVWNSMNPPPNNNAFDNHPNRDQYAGAECLFMIVMRGGVANCLDCGDLAGSSIGDKDGDGAFEFWDAWDRPIGYILWPGGLQLPADSGTPFFSASPPFAPGATGRTLRPLIYSAGADDAEDNPPKPTQESPPVGWYGFRCDPSNDYQAAFQTSNLASGAGCGDPSQSPASEFAKPLGGASDNLTNYDAEAKQ